jgi:hypothetical protein
LLPHFSLIQEFLPEISLNVSSYHCTHAEKTLQQHTAVIGIFSFQKSKILEVVVEFKKKILTHEFSHIYD